MKTEPKYYKELLAYFDSVRNWEFSTNMTYLCEKNGKRYEISKDIVEGELNYRDEDTGEIKVEYLSLEEFRDFIEVTMV